MFCVFPCHHLINILLIFFLNDLIKLEGKAHRDAPLGVAKVRQNKTKNEKSSIIKIYITTIEKKVALNLEHLQLIHQ